MVNELKSSILYSSESEGGAYKCYSNQDLVDRNKNTEYAVSSVVYNCNFERVELLFIVLKKTEQL